jgi:hypothetical protein
MMKICRIESVLYGTDEVEKGTRFFKDWGLHCIDEGRNGADFVLPSGQMIFVRKSDDASLPAAIEASPTAREITWGVDNTDSLEQIAAEMSRDRPVRRNSDGVIHTHDPNQCPIAFQVMRAAPSDNSLEQVDPAGPPMRPKRLAHVVYTVAKDRGRPTSDFYVERLQFRISDRILDNGDFLRAAGASDHHNLFIQHRVDRLTFNHAAFELDTFDEVKRAGHYFRSKGWETAIEPGGHFISGQQFWYFKNPCGGEAEYFATDKVFDDSWKTRVWETAPRVSA